VTDAAAPLLNLTNSGRGSDAINKVAVAHLCVEPTNGVPSEKVWEPMLYAFFC